MKNNLLAFFVSIFSFFSAFSQFGTITGSIQDDKSNDPIQNVKILIQDSEIMVLSDDNGMFSFNNTAPSGKQTLLFSKSGYGNKSFNVIVPDDGSVNINNLKLTYKIQISNVAIKSETLSNDKSSEQILVEQDQNTEIIDVSVQSPVNDQFTISLSDDELSDDTSGSDNISGLLQSSKDVFFRTAAYEFSSSFFKVRGLDSDNGIVHINGIEMNKLYNGRPQWSNWGGLNDVLRNQEFTDGISPSTYSFGGLLGSNNINVRASEYSKGGRVTYSSSNRSYTNRLMAT